VGTRWRHWSGRGDVCCMLLIRIFHVVREILAGSPHVIASRDVNGALAPPPSAPSKLISASSSAWLWPAYSDGVDKSPFRYRSPAPWPTRGQRHGLPRAAARRRSHMSMLPSQMHRLMPTRPSARCTKRAATSRRIRHPRDQVTRRQAGLHLRTTTTIQMRSPGTAPTIRRTQ
jgi:hypothetical protein